MSSKEDFLKYSYDYSLYYEEENITIKNSSGSADHSKKTKKKYLLALSILTCLLTFLIILIITRDLTKSWEIILYISGGLAFVNVVYFMFDKLL